MLEEKFSPSSGNRNEPVPEPTQAPSRIPRRETPSLERGNSAQVPNKLEPIATPVAPSSNRKMTPGRARNVLPQPNPPKGPTRPAPPSIPSQAAKAAKEKKLKEEKQAEEDRKVKEKLEQRKKEQEEEKRKFLEAKKEAAANPKKKAANFEFVGMGEKYSIASNSTDGGGSQCYEPSIGALAPPKSKQSDLTKESQSKGEKHSSSSSKNQQMPGVSKPKEAPSVSVPSSARGKGRAQWKKNVVFCF